MSQTGTLESIHSGRPSFRYGYAAPKDGGAFAVGATLAVCPWEPEHQLVRVAIKGREVDPQQRPASNLVFLIGVSGSMQSPDKLPLLKQSMITLVNQLDERDRVAIVVYSSRILKNEDFNNDKVDAGDIGAGHTVTAFYELVPPSASTTDALKYRPSPDSSIAADEWLNVKLRHKHPDGNESRKTEFSLKGQAAALDRTEPDFQFATAAALFGMKLRGMDEVKQVAWEQVIELATPGLKDDASEDRAEFVDLVKQLAGTRNPNVPAPAEVVPNQK